MKPENPTTASRARFHLQLWQCFFATTVDQTWQEKELLVVVVVVVVVKPALSIFRRIALENWRLKYCISPSNVQWVTSQWAPSEISPSCWPVVSTLSILMRDNLYADRYVERTVTVMQQRNLVAVTLSGWHNFFESQRLLRDTQNPTHGIQETRMKWTRSWIIEDFIHFILVFWIMAMVLAMFTSGSWLYFSHIQTVAFAEDAPFMLKLRQKMGKRSGRTRGRCGGPLPPHRPFEKQCRTRSSTSHTFNSCEHQLNRLALFYSDHQRI